MENKGSLIVGSEKLERVFGRWPAFHDAEILELHFDRGDVQTDKNIYKFPVLTLKIHLWEMTKQVDSQGFFVLRNHTLTTLSFSDVSDFRMEGFNHQNVVLEFVVNSRQRSKSPSTYFAVEVVPSFGMSASFECLGIEVLTVLPCLEDGKLLPDGDLDGGT